MSKETTPVFDFGSPAMKRVAKRMIDMADGLCWFELRKCKDQRSLKQNAYYHGVVIPHVAKGLEDAWGEKLTGEEVHDWLKGRFNWKPIVDHNTGEMKGRRPGSSASLDKSEFAEYLDKIIAFAAEQLNTEIPLADPSYGLGPTVASRKVG